MADSSGEKKHSATEQRRTKAKEEGQVVRSQDLASAALLLASMGVLRWRGPLLAEGLVELIKEGIRQAGPRSMAPSDGTHYLLSQTIEAAWLAIPILIAMLVAAILTNVLQTGPILATAKIMPKLSNIDPFGGTKRLFSISSVMRLSFGLFKVLVVSAVAFFALADIQRTVLEMGTLSIADISLLIFKSCIDTGLWIGGALLVLAILEYAFQWWKFEQDLKMTDQELRDELKNSQGDPQMIARRRQIQRKLAMDRVSNAVPTADVVVTNPTELAIALKYDPQTMVAPMVVAKGAGVIAQRIRRLALEHAVPIVERKPLAQVLYKTVEIGEAIPLDQYKAVAEVLKYVYQLRGQAPPQAAA